MSRKEQKKQGGGAFFGLFGDSDKEGDNSDNEEETYPWEQQAGGKQRHRGSGKKKIKGDGGLLERLMGGLSDDEEQNGGGKKRKQSGGGKKRKRSGGKKRKQSGGDYDQQQGGLSDDEEQSGGGYDQQQGGARRKKSAPSIAEQVEMAKDEFEKLSKAELNRVPLYESGKDDLDDFDPGSIVQYSNGAYALIAHNPSTGNNVPRIINASGVNTDALRENLEEARQRKLTQKQAKERFEKTYGVQLKRDSRKGQNFRLAEGGRTGRNRFNALQRSRLLRVANQQGMSLRDYLDENPDALKSSARVASQRLSSQFGDDRTCEPSVNCGLYDGIGMAHPKVDAPGRRRTGATSAKAEKIVNAVLESLEHDDAMPVKNYPKGGIRAVNKGDVHRTLGDVGKKPVFRLGGDMLGMVVEDGGEPTFQVLGVERGNLVSAGRKRSPAKRRKSPARKKSPKRKSPARKKSPAKRKSPARKRRSSGGVKVNIGV